VAVLVAGVELRNSHKQRCCMSKFHATASQMENLQEPGG